MPPTNPPSGASGGPGSSAPRSQQAQPPKRSVQAAFDGELGLYFAFCSCPIYNSHAWPPLYKPDLPSSSWALIIRTPPRPFVCLAHSALLFRRIRSLDIYPSPATPLSNGAQWARPSPAGPVPPLQRSDYGTRRLVVVWQPVTVKSLVEGKPNPRANTPVVALSSAHHEAVRDSTMCLLPLSFVSLVCRASDPADRGTSLTGYQSKVRVMDKYKVIGFISSGTYGRVYKALGRQGQAGEFAIKKFKPDKEGEVSYTGISQSAIREMALCTELSHQNVIHLVEIILEDKCIFMVFDYAEHDLLQIIHHHTQQPKHPIPPQTIKSIMFQLLNGCQYLHTNWVLHRDLKPANIMVTSAGEVKIGDLGLARLFWKPLRCLYDGDKVVVTIWYRAPELLLGSKHYTPAVDMWAVGCIFAELLSLRPIFKGEEAKMDAGKKTMPFQRNQMQKIVDIVGLPTKERWPLLPNLPDYQHLSSLQQPL
ncbi:CMGC/CDK/CDK8 protein kinase, partial [Magnaporthiopsis poae ATCC 64411]